MSAISKLVGSRASVAGLLLVQAALLLLTLDGYLDISIFCTGPASSRTGLFFTVLHFLLLALFPLGLCALASRRARPFYLALTVAALALLPVQAALVRSQLLTCDGP